MTLNDDDMQTTGSEGLGAGGVTGDGGADGGAGEGPLDGGADPRGLTAGLMAEQRKKAPTVEPTEAPTVVPIAAREHPDGLADDHAGRY